jgi:hypothetical protein
MTTEPQNPVSNLPPMEMPDNLEPVYSNLARISHTPSELIVDFSRMPHAASPAEFSGAGAYSHVAGRRKTTAPRSG